MSDKIEKIVPRLLLSIFRRNRISRKEAGISGTGSLDSLMTVVRRKLPGHQNFARQKRRCLEIMLRLMEVEHESWGTRSSRGVIVATADGATHTAQDHYYRVVRENWDAILTNLHFFEESQVGMGIKNSEDRAACRERVLKSDSRVAMQKLVAEWHRSLEEADAKQRQAEAEQKKAQEEARERGDMLNKLMDAAATKALDMEALGTPPEGVTADQVALCDDYKQLLTWARDLGLEGNNPSKPDAREYIIAQLFAHMRGDIVDAE